MTRDEVIQRLCLLQGEVHDKIVGYGHTADCFCGKGGMWASKRYSDADYGNDGVVLKWIENIVREAIAKQLSAAGAAI